MAPAPLRERRRQTTEAFALHALPRIIGSLVTEVEAGTARNQRPNDDSLSGKRRRHLVFESPIGLRLATRLWKYSTLGNGLADAAGFGLAVGGKAEHVFIARVGQVHEDWIVGRHLDRT